METSRPARQIDKQTKTNGGVIQSAMPSAGNFGCEQCTRWHHLGGSLASPMYLTQCPATKITLYLIPSFVWMWLAVIFLVSDEILTSTGIFHVYQERKIVRGVKKKLYHIALDTAQSSNRLDPRALKRRHHLRRCRALLLREFLFFCFFVPA